MADKAQEIEELVAEIRDNVDSGRAVTTQLATSQRIIARVTDGIYREPWAAFRELIANAYDADATRVIVETGAPDFDQVIVRDNGHGMMPDEVAYILKSIGGSTKRTESGERFNTVSAKDNELSPKGRPLIGKIGIGLFAVAQLTQHFQIITTVAGSNVKTSAAVRLRTHDEEKRSGGAEEQYVAGDVSITTETVDEVETAAQGTTIILYSLRPAIRQALQSRRRWQLVDSIGPDGKPVRDAPVYHTGLLPGVLPSQPKGIDAQLPWQSDQSPTEKFQSVLEAAADISGRSKAPANLEHFDEYLKLIWQLSLSLPLTYPDHHPFDFRGEDDLICFEVPLKEKAARRLELKADQSMRDALNLAATDQPAGVPFDVFLDDVQLRRPISLPKYLRRKSRLKAPMLMVGKVDEAFKPSELDRAGGQLSFEAYLYWNSQIIPKETSGALIRVREASGTLFDRSFMNYQISEQNRLSQITAEIFVRDGLDSAINIDRESFNYSHPHYLFIQKWLHRALRLLVNRNKQLAKEDLDAERAMHRVAAERSLISSAVEVWERQKGEDFDPPISSEQSGSLSPDIGGVEIDWSPNITEPDSPKASAIAIVLEAYGVLGQLDADDRSALILDLLKVLDDHS